MQDNDEEDFIPFDAVPAEEAKSKSVKKPVTHNLEEEEESYLPLESTSSNNDPTTSAFTEEFIPFETQETKPVEVPEPTKEDVTFGAPWISKKTAKVHVKDNLVRLHEEIADFTAFISPLPSERESRDKLVTTCRSLMCGIWKESEVLVFGSFSTELFIPSSDVDMVLLGSTGSDRMHRAAAALRSHGGFEKIQVIEKAKVPIIKFEDQLTSIPLNICFDVEDGLKNSAYVRTQLEKYPQIKPLVLVVKQFLYARELNDTYSGGIGSYLLLQMLLSVIQRHPGVKLRHNTQVVETNVGALLLEFFNMFGRQFNYEKVTISTRDEGAYMLKTDKGWDDARRPYLLSIEDPCNPDSDLGKNSYAIGNVRRAFEDAYFCLSTDPTALGRWHAHHGTCLTRCSILGWNLAISRPPRPRVHSVFKRLRRLQTTPVKESGGKRAVREEGGGEGEEQGEQGDEQGDDGPSEQVDEPHTGKPSKRPKKRPSMEMQPGDWECRKCGDVQFARNEKCRMCGTWRARGGASPNRGRGRGRGRGGGGGGGGHGDSGHHGGGGGGGGNRKRSSSEGGGNERDHGHVVMQAKRRRHGDDGGGARVIRIVRPTSSVGRGKQRGGKVSRGKVSRGRGR